MLGAPAVIERRAGRTALEVLTALGTMALPVLADLAALVAHRHADAGAMAAGALAAAAQITLGMIGRTPGLARQRIHARTMVGVAARGVMAAKAAVAPEQTALATGSVLIRILAQIGLIAAANLRIAEMFCGLLALLVLRLRDAVLAHHGSGVTLFAGEVAFNTALGKTMLADAADVTRIAALGRSVVLAIAGAVTALAADRRLMHVAVTVIVTPLAAGRSAVVKTVTAHVAALAAVGRLVLHAVAGQMAFLTARSGSVALTVVYAVIGKATGCLSMIALAGKVALSAAGRRHMFLAVAIEMTPYAAGCARMIRAIALKMARDPAGLRTAMLLSIPLGMLGIAARRLAAVIRSHRTGRHAHQQAQHQQR